MSNNDIIVSLDIGTSKVRAIIGKLPMEPLILLALDLPIRKEYVKARL